jgi:hypothetical protein
MPANPYQAPTSPSSPIELPSAALAGKLCAVASWSQLILVVVGIAVLYFRGRIGVLMNPAYAGLFLLAFAAAAPAAFFRLTPWVRFAAVVLAFANLSIWMVYVTPLFRPWPDDLAGLALGAAMLGFSLAIAILAALSPRARRDVSAGNAGHVVPRTSPDRGV